jgi:hypothetical protein
MLSQDLATPLSFKPQNNPGFEQADDILRHEKPNVPDIKLHMMSTAAKPKARRMSFKTISYLLGNFTNKAVRSQENERVSPKISNELLALKGSDKVVSDNYFSRVSKERRHTEDHFEDNQFVTESSEEEALSPVAEQEGSSTSDDSQESSIEAILSETQNAAERQYEELNKILTKDFVRKPE